jgi:hypothetical protein
VETTVKRLKKHGKAVIPMIYTIPVKTATIDSPERTRLKRELAAEALCRLEEAARTAEQFESVTKWWDRRDENRERRERYHEQRISNDMFDWNFPDLVAYEEDFLNIIFSCVCQMHNLTEDSNVSRLVKKATEKQKAVFFPRFIRRIANCHGMTDRNVRKLTDKMIENAQKRLFETLSKVRTKALLSKRQRLFLDVYANKDEKTKIVSITSHTQNPEKQGGTQNVLGTSKEQETAVVE